MADSDLVADMKEWAGSEIFAFLILMAVWFGIAMVSIWLIHWVLKRVFEAFDTDADMDIRRIIDWPVFILIMFYGFIESLAVIQVPDQLYDVITTIYRLVFSITAVYLVYKVYRSVIIPTSKDYSRHRGSTAYKSFIPLMDVIGGMAIVIIGILWILNFNGVDVMVFVAGLGILGIILGLALQDTISNFFSGLWIMMDQPFVEGDTVLFNDEYCEVIKVGFRSTRLYNILGHEYMVVPNNALANRTIINKNEPDLNLRITMDVGVEYGSPIEKVKEIIREGIESQDSVVHDDLKRRPVVNFRRFGDNSLEFRAWYYVREVLDQWRTAGLVQEHIDRRFREEGIVVAFPQRTVSYLGDRKGDRGGTGDRLPVRSTPSTSTS